MGKEAVGNVSAGKRRILIPLFVGLLVVAGVGVPVHTPATAAGDPDACTGVAVVTPSQVAGVYQITTAGELKHVADTAALWSEDFLVMNDISLENCGDWDPIGEGPVGGTAFTGTFDGGGHSISGLVIDLDPQADPVFAGQDDVGLFGFSSGASFTGVNLVDVDVKGKAQVGALVGQFVGTDASHKISDSSVTGTILGTINDIGGLVGRFNSPLAAIENSSSDSTVEGPSDVGGLVGEVDNGSIRNSWSKGQILDGSGSQIGGLVGDFKSQDSGNKGSITDSWSSATVEGGDDVGGLVGDFDQSGNIEDSYALGDVTAVDGAGGLVGRFDESGDITVSYATGNVVATKDKVGGLVGDFHDSGDILNSYAEGATSGRNRIGGLVGHFDGSNKIANSHATGNVTSTEDGTDYARAGGLVGRFYSTAGDHSTDGKIESSYSTGNVTATRERVGGLIGWFTGEVVNDTSYATGTVTGASSEIGGLIGRLGGGDISTVHATGSVIATGEEEDASYVGGLVGSTFAGIEIDQTYATGSVTVSNPSTDGRFGGLVGELTGTGTLLSASYATGSVTGGNHTGGLVGRVYDEASVESSYASNSVQGADSVGGLIGSMDGAAASVTTSYSTAQATGDSNVGGLVGEATNDATADRSFWDVQTSGLSISALGSGKDTAAMKTVGTYTSVTPPWDIVAPTAFGQPDISSGEEWGIGAGVNCGYPFLYWQDGSGHSCPVAEAGSVREKRADSPAIAMDLQASVGQQVTGAPVVIGGEGLAAGAPYTLIVRSTPTTVDSGSATSQGNFSARVTLPSLPPGIHTLTLSATAPNGTLLTLVQTVTVSSAGTFSAIDQTSGTHTGGLAATGVPDQSLAMGLTGFAILAGVVLIAASRRRLAEG